MTSKNWLFQISHEAARTRGGVGKFVRELIELGAVRNHFANNIVLAGPLLFPEEGDCRTSTNRDTLRRIKQRLNGKYGRLEMLYPTSNSGGLGDLYERLELIETTFDVKLYYLSGQEEGSDWRTQVLLVDQSSVFGQYFVRSEHFSSIVSKLRRSTGANLYPLPVHPNRMRLGDRIRREFVERKDLESLDAELSKEMVNPLAVHKNSFCDYDYILGLLIAEPLSKAIAAICGQDDRIAVMANDYFGLPSLYMAKRERGRNTTTILYVNEVNPARTLVEAVVPDPRVLRNLGDRSKTDGLANDFKRVIFGDRRFYRLMALGEKSGRSMGDVFWELAEEYEEARKRASELSITDLAEDCRKASGTLDVLSHASSRIFHLATAVDLVCANGEKTRRELSWLNTNIRAEDIETIAHGVAIDSPDNTADARATARKKIHDRLARTQEKDVVVVMDGKRASLKAALSEAGDNPYYFLKVSRPVPCKAFDRDVRVCSHLEKFFCEKRRKCVFLIASHWDTNQPDNDINTWIDLAQKGVGSEKVEFLQTIFVFINDFDWPRGELRNGRLVSRSDLFTAADVSLSQSRYESFGLAQLEPLQYGAICVVSGASGAFSILENRPNWRELEESIGCPIVAARYDKEPEATDGVIDIVTEQDESEEDAGAGAVADSIKKRLEFAESPRSWVDMRATGLEITKDCFSWELIGTKFVESCRNAMERQKILDQLNRKVEELLDGEKSGSLASIRPEKLVLPI